ncbi:MAG TPA: hypothetical protein VN032_06910 [Thermoanaerobaculia bacterium]|jgi:hypothetical protein|nr:hypothetical protein [Thermoanaerobaculia bacterium]
MSGHEERIQALRLRGAREREDLVEALAAARADAASFRQRWRFAGWAASGLAAAATMGWKLFGRNSLAARAGRIASFASLALGVGRGIQRVRRFW